MKKKLLARLAKLEARKKDLGTRASAATDVVELRSINSELDTLNEDIAELRSIIEITPDDVPEGTTPPAAPVAGENRGAVPQGQLNPIATYGMGSGVIPAAQRTAESEDKYATMEYRSAFMEFAKTGRVTPELRANEMTSVADISAVIPTTILNEVISKITTYGQIYSRVRKLSVKGGVSIPILSLKPTATWIGETTTSDKKKVQAILA
jgi:HK97 family phage major capsid protein